MFTNRDVRFFTMVITVFFVLLILISSCAGADKYEQINRGKFIQSLSKYEKPVGFRPVITVLPEGISCGVSVVVSGDRRYVRLSLSPMFSSIGSVQTFSFRK